LKPPKPAVETTARAASAFTGASRRIRVIVAFRILTVGEHTMIFAVWPVDGRRFPAKMEILLARVANRPLTDPVGNGVQHTDHRFRRDRAGRQAEPVRLADDGVAGDVAECFRDLPGGQPVSP